MIDNRSSAWPARALALSPPSPRAPDQPLSTSLRPPLSSLHLHAPFPSHTFNLNTSCWPALAPLWVRSKTSAHVDSNDTLSASNRHKLILVRIFHRYGPLLVQLTSAQGLKYECLGEQLKTNISSLQQRAMLAKAMVFQSLEEPSTWICKPLPPLILASSTRCCPTIHSSLATPTLALTSTGGKMRMLWKLRETYVPNWLPFALIGGQMGTTFLG